MFVSAEHAGYDKAFRQFLYLMHHQRDCVLAKRIAFIRKVSGPSSTIIDCDASVYEFDFPDQSRRAGFSLEVLFRKKILIRGIGITRSRTGLLYFRCKEIAYSPEHFN
jgi:hypothetical protein